MWWRRPRLRLIEWLRAELSITFDFIFLWVPVAERGLRFEFAAD
jgi:hypothetical protein